MMMNTGINVYISVPGTFHAFDLAEGLQERGYLSQIVISYPRFGFSTSIPDDKVSTIPIPEAIFQFGSHLSLRNYINTYTTWNSPFVRWKFRLFDKLVARQLPEPTSENAIFVGFAGATLHSIRRANELGYVTVVERSSVDIRTQRDLLAVEFDSVEDSKQPISDRHIQIEEQEYAETDYIVVPSEFVAGSFEKRGYTDKVVRIPLGDNAERTSVDNTATLDGISVDDDIFMYAGAVRLQKGVRYLLDAWKNTTTNDSHLVLVGPIDSELETILSQTDETVHAVGWQDNIDKLYASADYFVFPSIQDGFAQVVLEALFHGLPVIVSDHTGAKDCVRSDQDGFIIPSGDSVAIQEGLQRLVERDWDRESIAAHAQETYSMNSYIKNTVDAYKKMVDD